MIPEQENSISQKELEKISKRMAKLGKLIAETKERLPAHSIKPPVMMELLDYEDEYDMLLKKLDEFKTEL